jgi:hypothetical protein
MKSIKQRLVEPGFWQFFAVFAVASIVLIDRRPDAIVHAQFHAEDGRVWFADAYNFGWWHSLSRTQDGYFQSLPRLSASLALLVPFSLAPLVLNIIAILVQALPACLLLGARSSAWGSLRFRAVLAGVYLVLPNCAEMSFGITESQWLLAFNAFLLLVASAPKNLMARIFDLLILLLCGLTGPFCIFLLPIALFLARQRRDRWWLVPAGLFALCSLVQAWGLLIVNPSGRPKFPLGATPGMFTRILAGQVYIGALLGHNNVCVHPGGGAFLVIAGVALCGSAVVVFGFLRSSIEIRLFFLFSFALFAAALASPNCPPPAGVTVWADLAGISSIHYWFFPTLAFAWSILCCFHSRRARLKVVSAPLLLALCFGIVRDWREPAFDDLHFKEYVRKFEAAPAGTVVTIPLNPLGWDMQINKHASDR